MNSNTIIKRILIWSEMIALSLWGIFFTVVCYNFITPESWRFLSPETIDMIRPYVKEIGFITGIICVKCLHDEGFLDKIYK